MMRLSFARLAALAAALLFADPAAAELVPVPTGTRRHDRPDSSHTGLAGLYPSVGALVTATNTASGTLIGSQWVLTAAHVIAGGTASNFSFVVGGNSYVGAQIFIEPTWAGSLYAGNDLGLLRLASPVTNVTPAGYSAALDEIGRLGAIVGFGASGTGLTGADQPVGTKRAGQNVVDATADVFNAPNTPPNQTYSDRILMTDFDNPLDPADSLLGSPTPIDLEFNVAGGDSGGALFIDFGFGELLAGVASFLGVEDGTANSDYGDLSGFIRTSRHVAFIQSTTGIAPVAVPEPSALLLLLLSLIATAGGRFKRTCGTRMRVAS